MINTNDFERRIGFYLKKRHKKTPTNMEGVFNVLVNKYSNLYIEPSIYIAPVG